VLSAQASSLGVAGPSIFREGTSLSAVDAVGPRMGRFPNLDVSRAVQGNHRTEGAIIGGLLLGVPVLAVSLWIQDPDAGGQENIPVNTLVAAGLGALIGAFIGGAIPKEPDPEVTPAAGS
jgi:hypothetical protein